MLRLILKFDCTIQGLNTVTYPVFYPLKKAVSKRRFLRIRLLKSLKRIKWVKGVNVLKWVYLQCEGKEEGIYFQTKLLKEVLTFAGNFTAVLLERKYNITFYKISKENRNWRETSKFKLSFRCKQQYYLVNSDWSTRWRRGGEVDPVISWLLTKELSRPNFVNLNARRFYLALIIIGESI